MKLTNLTLLTSLVLTLTFTACTTTPKSNDLNTTTQTQATTTPPKFPVIVKRPSDEVTCLNCYATFKLSMGTQKQANGHSYTECPICHHNYLKKAKQ